jgi:hypothetical protein
VTPSEPRIDCETCEERLLDLLSGQMQAEERASLEASLARCPRCQALEARLRQGLSLAQQLELLDPPETVAARVMAVARQRAGLVEAQDAGTEPLRREPQRAWQRVLEWLGRAAMTQQVAMAMVMLLLVAVGLWYVPRSDRTPRAAGGSVVNPDPGAEAAATLRVDEPLPEAPVQPNAMEAAARLQEVKGDGALEGQPDLRRRARPAASHAREAATPTADRAPARKRRFAPSPTDPAMASGGAAKAPAAARSAGRLEAEPLDDLLNASLGSKASRGQGAEAPAARPEAFPAAAAAPAAMDEASSTADPAALHAQARQRVEAGGCGAATGIYERLLRQFTDYPDRGTAMLELGLCYQKLGQLDRARTWLERASRWPNVAARARAALAETSEAKP